MGFSFVDRLRNFFAKAGGRAVTIYDQPADHNRNGDEFLNDLVLVGQSKLMGHLQFDILTKDCGVEDVAVLREELKAKGVDTVIVEAGASISSEEMLFAYDRLHLEEYLGRPGHREILENAGWPTDVDGFVGKVSTEIIPYEDNPKLHSLIAYAYNDPKPFFQTREASVGGLTHFEF